MDQQQPMEQIHSNLVKTVDLTLNRSNSTSTVISEQEIRGEHIHPPATSWLNRSLSLRSLLKTSGLFNKDMESSDKLNELFTDGNEFTLHRLLSDMPVNDLNIDMNDLVRFDPMKILENRSISEFLQCDSFDQTNPSIDIHSNHFDSIPPSAVACSSESFSEFCPPTPELSTKEFFQIDPNQLKMEPEHQLIYTELNSFDNFAIIPSTSTPLSQEFNFEPSVLAAFEHDYGFLSKRSTVVNTPSPSPTISKRTSVRASRRTSSRLQSRAVLNNHLCLSPATSESSSTSMRRTKHARPVHRATDIQTEEDLSYYLERRRKNNEASKMSRASRKQKYGDMDAHCAEYERVNAELRLKISTLEVVTANLKNGLIHSFQRKGGVDPKF